MIHCGLLQLCCSTYTAKALKSIEYIEEHTMWDASDDLLSKRLKESKRFQSLVSLILKQLFCQQLLNRWALGLSIYSTTKQLKSLMMN